MRIPKYLSYSGMTQFFADRDEYFLRYLADKRPERAPQGKPAGVGSSFDAHVKAKLYDDFYGVGYMPEKYSLGALFEKQVEPHNRDYCLDAGKYVLDCYIKSGMYLDFLEVFEQADEPPQFEFRVEREVGGVPLIGLPDGYAKLKSGVIVIADWKVFGFCSKSSTSPNKGYLWCVDGFDAVKPSRSHQKSHKDANEINFEGLKINEQYMEDYSEKWAAQLSGYGWCMGEEVGSEQFVCMIHQAVGKPNKNGGFPLLRFADFKSRVRKPFQDMLLKQYQKAWDAVQSGHVYDGVSREANDKKVEEMQAVSAVIADSDDPNADFFNSVVRPDFRG